MSYYIHKTKLPLPYRNLYDGGVYEDRNRVDQNGFIDLGYVLEQNYEEKYNSAAIVESSLFHKFDSKKISYVERAYAPDYAQYSGLEGYFGGLDGVLRGTSPSFKKCLFDSSVRGFTGDLQFKLMPRDEYDEIDLHPYIQIYQDNTEIDVIKTYDNQLAHMPNKFLFILQGAGGGGGGGAHFLGSAGGSGGGSGALFATVIDFASSREVTVRLGKGGVGSNEGSQINGSDGEESWITASLGHVHVLGGKGGEYAHDDSVGGEGGSVTDLSGLIPIASQPGAKGGNRGGIIGGGARGGSFGLSQITLPTSQLVHTTLNATGGTGGAAPRYAGGGAGSFFGNGGDGGVDNGYNGMSNAGKNGVYGAGGGGGGDNAFDDEYGKGGNGGDAVLKIYY